MKPIRAAITFAAGALRIASIVVSHAADMLERQTTGGPPRPGDRVEIVAGCQVGTKGIVLEVQKIRDVREPRAFAVTIERYSGHTPISPPVVDVWPKCIDILERREERAT